MSDAIRLERVTARTYRIRTSRFAAKPAASSIDQRRQTAGARWGTWREPSRFATGNQRIGEGAAT